MKLVTVELPDGEAATWQTVFHMRQLVASGLTSPVILRWAQDITERSHDPVTQVNAINAWLHAHFYFAEDPTEVNGVRVYDLLAHPVAQLEQYERFGRVVGDCDEAATLVAVLGKANLRPAKFRLVGFGPEPVRLSHVYTLLRAGGRWYNLDVTRPPNTVIRPTRTVEVTV